MGATSLADTCGGPPPPPSPLVDRRSFFPLPRDGAEVCALRKSVQGMNSGAGDDRQMQTGQAKEGSPLPQTLSGSSTLVDGPAHLETRAEPEPAPVAVDDSRSILLVEDNPGDIRLVREALRRSTIQMRLFIAHDGLEALQLLQRGGRKPDVILLDLNLPGLDGRAVLRRVKSTPELARIPVVVLSSSSAYMDVRNSYDQRANCYVVKPTDFETFERTIRHLVDFWAGLVHLPDD